MTAINAPYMLRAINEVIADSRKLASSVEGEYYIRIADGMPRNVQKKRMAELGIIGTPITVRHSEYEDARTRSGNARTKPIKVYPVNFERAEFYMDKLSAIMCEPGAKRKICEI